jgi:hypothetical protein
VTNVCARAPKLTRKIACKSASRDLASAPPFEPRGRGHRARPTITI